MLRVLFYFVVIAVLGLGFAWLADRPGELHAVFAGNQYSVPLITAAAMLVALVAVILICWWLIKSIWQSPYILHRHFRARKRDRGYQALSTGLIAAGAGDAVTARLMMKRAAGHLSSDQEPLIKLLDVQTAMLEGRTDDARKGFEALIEDPETRLLGLRGLYIEAQRAGAMEAARHYAAEAAKLAPQLEWASSAVMGQLCAEGDWDGALKLVDARKQALAHGKDVARKERAALLTARAMANIDTNHAAAKADALEANRLAPDLVPAAVTAARALFTGGEVRKGSRILEAAWKRFPHPDIAAAYIDGRAGDTAQDRLKRARHLVSLRSHTVEGSLALARAAYDAGDYKLARENVEKVIRSAPRESAYLLLADIEEAETGDQGKVRQWLSMAVKAPRDPVWTADGYASEQWSPVSPVTGRLNSFEWKTPVEQLSPVIEAHQPEVRGAVEEAKALSPVVHLDEARRQARAKAARHDVEDAQTMVPAAEPARKAPAQKPEKHDTLAEKNDEVEDAHLPQGPIVFDDPGVDEDERQRKAKNAFRLF